MKAVLSKKRYIEMCVANYRECHDLAQHDVKPKWFDTVEEYQAALQAEINRYEEERALYAKFLARLDEEYEDYLMRIKKVRRL